jgi:AraC family transcriptional regulator
MAEGARGNHLLDLLGEGWRKYPKSALLSSSLERGWSTIGAELRTHPAGTIVSHVQENVEVVVAIAGDENGFVIRNSSGHRLETRPAPRTVWLAPIGVGGEECVVTAALPQALHLYLPTSLFELLAGQHSLVASQVNSIQYVGGFKDDLICAIGQSLLTEMTDPSAGGRLLVETSALTLAARLACAYGSGEFVNSRDDGPIRLDDTRLRRVLDYIHQHLEEDLSVAQLADVAHLSVFHFARMFNASVGVPPHRYVSTRRLENAMALLEGDKLPISEIAFRSCFSSQASFSRAFRRATGTSPSEFRRAIR